MNDELRALLRDCANALDGLTECMDHDAPARVETEALVARIAAALR